MKSFFFARDFVIHGAASACVYLITAEVFLGNFFADATLHYWRTSYEELARPSHHQREM